MENVPVMYVCPIMKPCSTWGHTYMAGASSLALCGVHVHDKGHFAKSHVHRDILQVKNATPSHQNCACYRMNWIHPRRNILTSSSLSLVLNNLHEKDKVKNHGHSSLIPYLFQNDFLGIHTQHQQQRKHQCLCQCLEGVLGLFLYHLHQLSVVILVWRCFQTLFKSSKLASDQCWYWRSLLTGLMA